MSFDKHPTFPHFPHGDTHEIPEKIGPYKIEVLLEKGGMSMVYLGTQPETNLPTTIKVLLPKFLSRPEVVQRFLNEAEIISITSHPNIVKLFGQGKWEGGLYIAMEYIAGMTLRQYLTEHPMSMKRALNIIIDVAYALCHLHSHGVIHRDLKPENILVTNAGEIKVIDFGIAQLLAEKPSSEESQKHHLVGTPIYISPEQKANPETVSYPSDIYSLGIIAYELILGKLCYGKIHLSLIPQGMQKILQKCLLPNPKDRYQDIVDFISDVSAFLNSPELEKESRAHDRVIELSDDLKRVQRSLVPKTPPAWTGIEVAFEYHVGIGTSGIYFDFFDLSEGRYAVILSESVMRGAEGIVYIASLRGMVRSLKNTIKTPAGFAHLLNKLLTEDALPGIFSFKVLIIDTIQNKLHFTSCGHGDLWILKKDLVKQTTFTISSQDSTERGKARSKRRVSNEEDMAEAMSDEEDRSGEAAAGPIPDEIVKVAVKHSSHNLPLGKEPNATFSEQTLPWDPSDTVFIQTIGVYTTGEKEAEFFDEAEYVETLTESANQSPQHQVENIIRRSLISTSPYTPDRTLACICLKRCR